MRAARLSLPMVLAICAWGAGVRAADDTGGKGNGASAEATDPKNQTPQTAYAWSAFGNTRGVVGASAFGSGLAATGVNPSMGAGARVWGAPVEGLTLMVEASRSFTGKYAPSAGALFRIAGSYDDGWAFAAIGRYKAEGFAEAEGEAEVGALFSFTRKGFHADVNALGGSDFDANEVDGEAHARVGYDLTSFFRIGLDGQARWRIAGSKSLVGGRKWDFVAGPQLLFSYKRFFLAMTSGPSTVDVASGVGWTVLLMAGGTTL